MRGKSNPDAILLIIYLETISWEEKNENPLCFQHSAFVLQLELKRLPFLAPCNLDASRNERRVGLHPAHTRSKRTSGRLRNQELSAAGRPLQVQTRKELKSTEQVGLGQPMKIREKKEKLMCGMTRPDLEGRATESQGSPKMSSYQQYSTRFSLSLTVLWRPHTLFPCSFLTVVQWCSLSLRIRKFKNRSVKRLYEVNETLRPLKPASAMQLN